MERATEDLYIDLYDAFVPTAEYLQADEEYRNFLPEGAVLAGLAFALKEFADALFSEAGKAAGGGIVGRIRSLFGKAEETGERRALLDGLDLLRPHLDAFAGATAEQRAVHVNAVAIALEGRGYPADVARDTADRLSARLLERPA